MEHTTETLKEIYSYKYSPKRFDEKMIVCQELVEVLNSYLPKHERAYIMYESEECAYYWIDLYALKGYKGKYLSKYKPCKTELPKGTKGICLKYGCLPLAEGSLGSETEQLGCFEKSIENFIIKNFDKNYKYQCDYTDPLYENGRYVIPQRIKCKGLKSVRPYPYKYKYFQIQKYINITIDKVVNFLNKLKSN